MRRLLVIAPLVLLAACGSGGGTETAAPSATPTAASAPSCATVLKAGALLPKSLPDTGCVNVQGNLEFPGILDCTDGRQMLGDKGFYGYLGEQAQAGDASSPAYSAAYKACRT